MPRTSPGGGSPHEPKKSAGRSPVRACGFVRPRLADGCQPGAPRATPGLPRRQDRLQLPRRPLDGERGRLERSSHHRQHGPRRLPEVLARRPLDCLLVEPLRQLRCLCRRRRRRGAAAPHVPYRERRGGRVDAGLAARRLPRDARRRGVPDGRDAASGAGLRWPGAGAAGGLGILGQLLARRQVNGVQPPPRRVVKAALPRQLRGGRLGGRRGVEDLQEAARRRALQPLLAHVGRGRRHLLRGRPAARRAERQARQPGGPQEREQHLQDPGSRRAAGAGDETQRRQPVLALDVGRRQGHRLRGQLRHLEAGCRHGAQHRDQARYHQRREGERARDRGGHQPGGRLRHLAVGAPRGHLRQGAAAHYRDGARRHHPHCSRQDGVAQRLAEVVAGRQADRVRIRSVRP